MGRASIRMDHRPLALLAAFKAADGAKKDWPGDDNEKMCTFTRDLS
jgi:hypothetical protein